MIDSTAPVRHRPPTPPTSESPCIKVCQLDLDQRCRGCGRTVDEITRWRDMTSAERIAVNQRIGFVSHERRRGRAAGWLLVMLAAMLAVTLPLGAHAMRHLRLVRSAPTADAVLPTSPDAIRLWLSEPAEAPVSKITVTTTAGAAVALGPVTRDAAKDAPLVARITTPLAAGGYRVSWKAMSKDGHVVRGEFGFRVGH